MRKNLLAATAMIALALPVGQASALSLTNTGFEAGLAGWTTIGDVTATASTNVTTSGSVNWSILAYQTMMAQLNSNGDSAANIEIALGLAPGALDAGNANPSGGSLTNASAIYQDFTGTIGETITEYFNYVARDYIPFNDPSYAIVLNLDTGIAESIDVLASIHGLGVAVGTDGNSGWQIYSHTLGATGNYRLAFVTTNDKDFVLDSALFLDNEPGSCLPSCPPIGVAEPASFALLGFGLVGLAAIRRRWAA